MWTCAVVLAVCACAGAITRDQFYPHGHGVDQRLPRGSEVTSPEIHLKVPVIFYGETYESIFVNNYGVLSFRAEIPSFLNAEFPLPYPSIAPFYSNIDTTETGAIYFRETNEPHVLSKAEESVQNNFPEYHDFKPTSVFVATWVEVTYKGPRVDRKNSFQAAIISNGNETFVEFLYPEREIQWIQREAEKSSIPDAKAQVGFIAEDGRIFTLRGSGTHQIRNIISWSNMHEPGKYVFRVGNIPLEGNVAVPDTYDQNEIEEEEESKTCAQSGPSVCHMQANCVDYETGICCQCKEGYYGNGKSCIKITLPIRVHGKLNGALNDVPLDDIDIQAYIQVDEGRTYTAISQAPQQLGPSLQLLNVLGGVIGWIFAKPWGAAKNGYQLTGGIFNHTADIFFPSTGHRVTINQEFLGQDVFDQIALDSDVRGTIPIVASGSKLEVSEYEEYFTNERNLIRSEATRVIRNKRTGEQYELRISQTFTYNSCRFAPVSEEDSIPTTLKVAKTYLGFEDPQNIIRYGMSNKIVPLGEEDPCKQGKNTCGPHSTCVVKGDSYSCVCQSGFSSLYINNQGGCVDIDECAAFTHNCDNNADCYNNEGGFQCKCRSGYEGNGATCNRISQCRSLNCDPNARCEERYDEPVCICNPGYTGDGRTCSIETQRSPCDVCSPYAFCTFDATANAQRCKCREGYTGDGRSCTEIGAQKYPSPFSSTVYNPNTPAYNSHQPTYARNAQEYNPEASPPETYPTRHYPNTTPYDTNPTPENPDSSQYNPYTNSASYNPEQYNPSPEPYNPNPEPYNPNPQQYNPNQYNPNPEQYNPNPQQYNPNQYDPNPEQYNPNPQQYNPNQYNPDPEQYNPNPEQYNPSPQQYHPNPEQYNPSDYREPHNPNPEQYNPNPNSNLPPYNPHPSLWVPKPNQYNPYGTPQPSQPNQNSWNPTPSETYPTQTSPTTTLTSEAENNDQITLPHCDEYGVCSCPANYTHYSDPRVPGNNLCRLNSYIPPPYNTEDYYRPSNVETNNDTSVDCDSDTTCPENAYCYFSDESGSGHCECNDGYVSDSYSCVKKPCDCGINAHCVENFEGYSCLCNPGYGGDGYSCRPYASCNTNSDCEINAQCRRDDSEEYVCQCVPGYTKDENDACVPEAQLCDGAICVEHASCLYDAVENVNYCHCDRGYEGSGISQCIEQGTSCDVANDCDPNAACTPTDISYRCVCNEGYTGDGYQCALDDNCSNNPYLCDVHASCLKRSNVFICECNAGYNGNGTHCALNPKPPGNFLVASDGASVYKVPFKSSPRDFATPINSAIYQIAVGVDVDCETGRIFWGDVVGNAIRTAAYDGSKAELFLSNDVKSPEGVSIDWSARNIFWTDSRKLTIEVANLDTKIRKVLFTKDGISNPRGIVVHPHRGKIFWSDWNRSDPKIEWANMDGSERGVFVDKSDVKLPNSLAIDFLRDRLCYADAGTFNIKCVAIDTMERETIADGCSYPFGLATNGNTFYWSDWKTLKIESIDTLTRQKSQLPISTSSRRLYGVAIAPDQCPASYSVCQGRNNCQTNELCLPDGRNGRTCVLGEKSFEYGSLV